MPKVLVLDDDEDIASVVAMILDMNGYSAEYITDHNELKQKLQSFAPDLLILDIALGDADGRLLCKELKEQKETAKLPVILFSANRDASLDFERYHAHAFIPKPFEAATLISIVSKISA